MELALGWAAAEEVVHLARLEVHLVVLLEVRHREQVRHQELEAPQEVLPEGLGYRHRRRRQVPQQESWGHQRVGT